ncbi:EAL domain-containing protein [Sphingomonas mucosissima]|uniref:Phytochrome-like protein cph2 n=1 Tax=Sphingomonas mucosissima TaxID=370959 RepID=A0A245ZDL8_9SPHN|nr:EAL domain-containing protein [Sphingomonas mucosissima]OWK27852.1 phytochrome-like protein cph2 [Sphingomonas mucosissima]
MPFSRLKLDRSLVQNLTVRSEAQVLAQTIISMANSLGLHSIAEGVETRDQLELLSVMGCDEVQGYLLSRPISHSDLEDLLANPGTHVRTNTSLAEAA